MENLKLERHGQKRIRFNNDESISLHLTRLEFLELQARFNSIRNLWPNMLDERLTNLSHDMDEFLILTKL